MPGFEDIFGPVEDIMEPENQEKTDEWDTGAVWDSGEKENIWRAEPATSPGDVWATGGGWGGCGDQDDCDADTDCGSSDPQAINPTPDPVRPNDPISEGIAGPLSKNDSENTPEEPKTDTSDVEQPLRGGGDQDSEYDEMDQFDHLIDGDGDSEDEEDSPSTGLFDDIW